MRVLVVVNQVTHDQSVLWEFANRDQSVKVHLTGAAPRKGLEAYEPSQDLPVGVPTSIMEPRVLRRNADHLWWYYPELASKILQVDPDLVHVHSEMWGMTVLQALRLHPTVVAHGADNQFHFGSGLERFARSKILKYAASRIAGYVSWNKEGAVLAQGLQRSLSTEVVPGVPVRKVEHLQGGDSTAPGITVGFVGRLTRAKGVLTLLEAIRLFQASGSSSVGYVKFVVVGDGPELESVLQSAEEGTVSYLGALAHDQVLKVLGTWDLLVVPSIDTRLWKEQYCRSAVEALCQGVAVLHSDAGALPEVVDDGGLQFAQGDPYDLFEKLRRLIEEPLLRASYSDAGRRRYDAYHDPQVLAAKLTGFWSRVASEQGRPL